MNDSKLIDALKASTGLNPPAHVPPPALVQLGQQIVNGIASGAITSLACIVIGPNGQIQWPGFGMQSAELMIGAELMRDDMKAAMRGGGSKILRAG
jgi:hypothetical protein